MNKETKDFHVLAQFASVYCDAHHPAIERQAADLGIPTAAGFSYCAECLDFLRYAMERRRRCPLDPKPACKACPVHCYRPGHREKVREIMRFSGLTLIKRGRFDLLWHYFF
jgi:hypothetical protein